ncbi:hypothetical protein TNCT_484021 [Trichonephila clavata]|uniref:Uncharacterized protein n=1 Tax=Trichonephila clavata TaxID=2740835 RepID=A0A8X6HG46_TRICU|nr:hypothetical protein TNCT_484021 [Trichonephila clavata]
MISIIACNRQRRELFLNQTYRRKEHFCGQEKYLEPPKPQERGYVGGSASLSSARQEDVNTSEDPPHLARSVCMCVDFPTNTNTPSFLGNCSLRSKPPVQDEIGNSRHMRCVLSSMLPL